MKLNIFSKKYINDFYKLKYNLSNNNNLLVSLINNKKNFLKFKENNDIKIKIKEEPYNININKLLESDFIIKDILKNEYDKLPNNFSISWNNNIIYVKCTETKNIIKKLKLLVYIIEYIKEINNIKLDVKAYLFLCDLKKLQPDKWISLSVNNVNSGYTDNMNKYMFIWRYEEFEKVLMHEVVHLFNLDKKNNTYCEAITDYYGIQYYLIYLSIMLKTDIKLLLELEITFMRNQAYILYNNVPENSPSYIYYIVKYILFITDNIDFNHINNKLNIDMNIKIIYTNSMRMTLLQIA